MIKTWFVCSCRIVLMLGIIAVVAVVGLVVYGPDLSFSRAHLASIIAQQLHADQVRVSDVKLSWQAGPALDVGQVDIDAASFSVHGTHALLTINPFDILILRFVPELRLAGGEFAFDLDARQEQAPKPLELAVQLEDVSITWTLQGERQSMRHVSALVMPLAEYISVKADGIDFSASLNARQLPQHIRLQVTDFSWFPQSWRAYLSGVNQLDFSADIIDQQAWHWQLDMDATQGLIAINQIHFRLPFQSLDLQGKVHLDIAEKIELKALNIDKFKWKDGDNFGDFKLKWSDDVMRVDALDGSVAMPLLWSWLWMLGDEDWHAWLNSMRSGRVRDVRATLELDWKDPLRTLPTYQNALDMTYHVEAQGSDIDIALGLEGDFLYGLEGHVLVDETHLEADVSHVVLQDGIATGSGTYRIDWHDLVMRVKARGVGDVGRLHAWLDHDTARDLHWGDSPARADISMVWDAHKNEPDTTIVSLVPYRGQWYLNYNDIPIVVSGGTAIWDFQKGLTLKRMPVELPWFQGDFSMFLDKFQDWSPQTITLDATAPLADLTRDFVLPITHPTGITRLHLVYEQGIWQGKLNLSRNDWDNFAGYDKEGKEELVISFRGKSSGKDVLPIEVDEVISRHEDGFSFTASALITEDTLDLKFKDVDTPAFLGDFTLHMPLDSRKAWSLMVDAEYMDKPVLTSYLKERGGMDAFTRPWSVTADVNWMEWEKSSAQGVKVHFSSDQQAVGEVSAAYFLSGDADLQNIRATFSLNGKGMYDLHLLEAHGAGQVLRASGSVQTLKDGALQWKGLALMDGEFGTLMEQAELDKLFKEGEMSALFVGRGEYKDGEPWWRKMKGGFKLRVIDGRIMEGGTLTHLLAAISLVDLPKYLIFDRGDVVGEGLLYDKLQLEGVFNNNILNIDRLAFLSSALDAGGKGQVDLDTGNLDIVLVARPWQNIESLIGSIPGIGRVLMGEDKSLLRKVYHIHGPASDAVVDEITPEEAGLPKGGYLEDLFTPSKWFEPKKKEKTVVKDK